MKYSQEDIANMTLEELDCVIFRLKSRRASIPAGTLFKAHNRFAILEIKRISDGQVFNIRYKAIRESFDLFDVNEMPKFQRLLYNL